MGSLIQSEALLVEVYRDCKKAVQLGYRKLQIFNRNRQLVALINLLRSTESANTKTIAFQTDGLPSPLWKKLFGKANSNRKHLLSWAKTEKMLLIRDSKICVETGSPRGTMREARDLVLSSVVSVKEDAMCTISRAFGWGVLEEKLDVPKSQALRQRLGNEFTGIYAGDLSLCDLFTVSDDDVDISESRLSGIEIPIGFATCGENQTVVLLLSDRDVILLNNERKVKKYLSSSQERSINFLFRSKKPLADPLAKFLHCASATFWSETGTAYMYLTAIRFVQTFLSLSTCNLSQAVDDEELCNKAVIAFRRDAMRLEHIRRTCYIHPGTSEYIDLSSDEMKSVHLGQASLSEDQHSRIFHDLAWQERVYNEASFADEELGSTMVGTLSDDENRNAILDLLFQTHETSIRKKRTVEDKGKNFMKLNLAIMCYNRLTNNEYATAGFEKILKQHESTVVSTSKYRAIYTPHSGAAVLYFDDTTFSDLKLRKFQPNRGKQESILGLVAVLHNQIKSEDKPIVDAKVYEHLQEGLHNITGVQDLVLETIRNGLHEGEVYRLKVSHLYISISQYTENLKIRKWLEREVLGFLAFHGVPKNESTAGVSTMYDAFSDFYGRTVSGLEITIDRAGNLNNCQIRVSQNSGSFLLCDEEDGRVLKVRKQGKDIKDIGGLSGRLQLVCRPGKAPEEEYVDAHLADQEV